jgi:transcriptional regulator with XRE-family HTH domain
VEEQSFAEFFREHQEASGLLVPELAERSGLSKQLLYFYLDGKRLPTPDTVDKLASALNLDPDLFAQYARKGIGRPAKN